MYIMDTIRQIRANIVKGIFVKIFAFLTTMRQNFNGRSEQILQIRFNFIRLL